MLWDKDFLNSLPTQAKTPPESAFVAKQKTYQHGVFKEHFMDFLEKRKTTSWTNL